MPPESFDFSICPIWSLRFYRRIKYCDSINNMRDNTVILLSASLQTVVSAVQCSAKGRVFSVCVLHLVYFNSQQRTIVISKLLVFKYRSRPANPSYQQGLYFKAKVLKVYIGKIIFVYFGKLPYCDTEA